MTKKVLVLLGHPDKNTTCDELASVYEAGAKESGHDVKRVNLSELQFDPILHKGYHEIQRLEPDLLRLQEDFKWADHIAIFYPNWWSSMPALLKGMFDRMFLPGFAFHFNETHTNWTQLLKGRTARVVITMENWPLVARFMFGDYTNEIGKAILGFSGIHPVRISKVGPVRNLVGKRKERLLSLIRDLGKRAK